jgi:hypothetical protein
MKSYEVSMTDAKGNGFSFVVRAITLQHAQAQAQSMFPNAKMSMITCIQDR